MIEFVLGLIAGAVWLCFCEWLFLEGQADFRRGVIYRQRPAMTASEAVTGIVDELKSQPLSLALVIMNVALLALVYVIIGASERRHDQVAAQQKQLVELLANCVGQR